MSCGGTHEYDWTLSVISVLRYKEGGRGCWDLCLGSCTVLGPWTVYSFTYLSKVKELVWLMIPVVTRLSLYFDSDPEAY